jgi:glycosyltransferase involved in cell wall biosynthesis
MLPKVTVVTPSFNQGDYLEETILSVVEQDYPNLEYILMDGGSTDNSLDIIHKYEKYFAHWESAPDKGQADVINKGFRISTGNILAWLNSDDMYLPGTLEYISKHFENSQDLKIVFGNCRLFKNERKYTGETDVVRSNRTLDISLVDYIYQPSCFWTKTVWEKVGPLNIDLVYCLDWDWFIRSRKLGIGFESVNDFLSLYRIHAQHKSAKGGKERIKEIAGIYQTYHTNAIAQDYLKLRLNPIVQLCEKLMRRMRFPWRRGVMRFLFLKNLSNMQYDSLILM